MKMQCPVCGGADITIRGTMADCESIHRQKMCLNCGHVFYTSEYESDGKEFTRLMREYENDRYHRIYKEKAQERYRMRKQMMEGAAADEN